MEGKTYEDINKDALESWYSKERDNLDGYKDAYICGWRESYLQKVSRK